MKAIFRSRLFWVATVILIAAAIAVPRVAFRAKGIAVTTGQVTRGNITSTVTATGKIFPRIEVRISSEVPGEIIELPVSDGMQVQRGDLLVRINPDTLEAQVKQQEASLSATRSSAAQNRAQMLQSELDLRRIEELHGHGYATEDQLEQARTNLEVRKASYESALHQIERQDMQLREAADKLAKSAVYAPMDGTVVSLAAEVGDRVVGTGQFAGTEIMRVANLETMEVRVDVSESDIIHVAVGQKAQIEIDSLPGETFLGTVAEIAHSARTTGDRTQEQLTTFQVKVQLDQPSARIRPGMTATAEIETATVSNVLRVPLLSVVVRPTREVREALGRPEGAAETAAPVPTEARRPGAGGGQRVAGGPGGGRPGGAAGGGNNQRDQRSRIVFVVADGKAQMREVQTGIADKNFITIESGLQEGDVIITGSYTALTRELTHDAAIRVTEAAARGARPARSPRS